MSEHHIQIICTGSGTHLPQQLGAVAVEEGYARVSDGLGVAEFQPDGVGGGTTREISRGSIGRAWSLADGPYPDAGPSWWIECACGHRLVVEAERWQARWRRAADLGVTVVDVSSE
ncbi:hypothetical protein [Sporichthya sp.]|uniref:hypothetical protein n=1 Tax=Sporichthya sp. TaxID=65475 RepID=UPI0017C533A4|nr:hypothetical protein [Sporichthya sp.]MBA3742489.1 hypothetical protein [Sporichthya sp.]